MKPLKNRLLEAKNSLGLPWEVMERDYILSWILAGVANTPTLKNTIIFKGGTALKKCFFGNYRMSEDLDFTGNESTPKGEAMEAAIKTVCEKASAMLNEYAPIEINCERYTERDPHPGGQEAFTIKARLPWHRQPHVRIIIEITMDETIINQPSQRPILHSYGEPITDKVLTYPLEEIIAEKLRAILQQQKLLEQRGWVRSRARDYYDLWRILGAYKEHLKMDGFVQLLEKKCIVRNVNFKDSESFFSEKIISFVEETWEQWLQPLVNPLPDSKVVINTLKNELKNLIPDV